MNDCRLCKFCKSIKGYRYKIGDNATILNGSKVIDICTAEHVNNISFDSVGMNCSNFKEIHAWDEYFKKHECFKNGDCISREEAIKQIQKYGVGCFDADDFSVEQCTRFVIGKLNELDSVESEVKE